MGAQDREGHFPKGDPVSRPMDQGLNRSAEGALRMIELRKEWLSEPINCTCEVMVRNDYGMLCEKPAVAAYPAMGGGWMALCERHARQYLPHLKYKLPGRSRRELT